MTPLFLSGILGFLVPPVVAFLKNSSWPKPVKVGLMVVVSAVFAFASLLQDGQLGDASVKQILANLAVVVAVSQLFYQTYFADTDVNAKLEAKKVL